MVRGLHLALVGAICILGIGAAPRHLVGDWFGPSAEDNARPTRRLSGDTLSCGSFNLSGIVCPIGHPSLDANQVYEAVGVTADGRPYYRGITNSSLHIFYDSNCGFAHLFLRPLYPTSVQCIPYPAPRLVSLLFMSLALSGGLVLACSGHPNGTTGELQQPAVIPNWAVGWIIGCRPPDLNATEDLQVRTQSDVWHVHVCNCAALILTLHLC